MIPSFLLAKLYVKDSLKNTASGFEFTLKNNLDSTMLIGIGPIGLGGKNYAGETVNITVGDKTINAAELSRQTSVPVRVGTLIKVSITGEKLTAGLQKINVTAISSDIGQIKFDISDTLS
jgi:hydroxymethylglutaryl-CoA reductase (NADPH)